MPAARSAPLLLWAAWCLLLLRPCAAGGSIRASQWYVKRARKFVGTDTPYTEIAFEPGNAECWEQTLRGQTRASFARCCNSSKSTSLAACWRVPGLSFERCCGGASLPPSPLPRAHRTVAAISTTPHRFYDLNHVIESLAHQTHALDAIYLSLPYVFARDWSFYEIPYWYMELAPRQLRINRCEQDFRPETGLLCALQHEPDPSTRILVADDDMAFGPTLVENLLRASLARPGAMVDIYTYLYVHIYIYI